MAPPRDRDRQHYGRVRRLGSIAQVAPAADASTVGLRSTTAAIEAPATGCRSDCVSSQETNHLNHRISSGVPSRSNKNGATSSLLEPTEIEALRMFFLLLDRWEREEGDNGE